MSVLLKESDENDVPGVRAGSSCLSYTPSEHEKLEFRVI